MTVMKIEHCNSFDSQASHARSVPGGEFLLMLSQLFYNVYTQTTVLGSKLISVELCLCTVDVSPVNTVKLLLLFIQLLFNLQLLFYLIQIFLIGIYFMRTR